MLIMKKNPEKKFQHELSISKTFKPIRMWVKYLNLCCLEPYIGIVTVFSISGSERKKKYEMERAWTSRPEITCYHKIFTIQG